MGPTIFPLFFSFPTTFTPPTPFYILKINGSHHFTHFSFSFPLLYTYFLTSVLKPNVKNWVGRREYILLCSVLVGSHKCENNLDSTNHLGCTGVLRLMSVIGLQLYVLSVLVILYLVSTVVFKFFFGDT